MKRKDEAVEDLANLACPQFQDLRQIWCVRHVVQMYHKMKMGGLTLRHVDRGGRVERRGRRTNLSNIRFRVKQKCHNDFLHPLTLSLSHIFKNLCEKWVNHRNLPVTLSMVEVFGEKLAGTAAFGSRQDHGIPE